MALRPAPNRVLCANAYRDALQAADADPDRLRYLVIPETRHGQGWRTRPDDYAAFMLATFDAAR